jgi:hypothetical protein
LETLFTDNWSSVSISNNTRHHDVPILQQTRLYEDGRFVSELLKGLTIPGKEDLKDILAEWENRTEYIVPFDAEKRVNESQVTKDKAKFQKSNQVTMQVLSASDYEIVLSHAGRAGDSRKLKKIRMSLVSIYKQRLR